MKLLTLTCLTAICLLTASCAQAAASNPSQSTESLIASLTKVLNDQLEAPVVASTSGLGVSSNLGVTSASGPGGVIRPLTNVSKNSPLQWTIAFDQAGEAAGVFVHTVSVEGISLEPVADDKKVQDFLIKQAEQFLRQGHSKRAELRFLLDLLEWHKGSIDSITPLIAQFVQLVLEINGTPIPDPQAPPNPHLLTILTNNTNIIPSYILQITGPNNSQNGSNLFFFSGNSVGNEIRINNLLIQAVPPPVSNAPKDCSIVYCG